MIKSVNNYPISELLNIESNVLYAVPRYQREYTWGKSEWQHLFDDIWNNDDGYFLGSIICINQSTDTFSVQRLEIVDGQQRIATLSLLFAALHARLDEDSELLDDEEKVEQINLKRKLVLKRNADQARIILQIQNSNQKDYRAVLAESGVLKTNEDVPPYAGNRKIFKAYRYFQSRVSELADHTDGQVNQIMQLLDKINRATLVKIEVESHSDAYTLFESLNNRGVPLTAIDLIKNKLLSKLERIDPGRIDHHFESWNRLLDYLGDDYAIHERFFRQYYNAFKKDLSTIVNVPVATRSNIMQIYEKIIEYDAEAFLDEIIDAGKWYSFILRRTDNDEYSALDKSLLDLERIQGTPSYLLLLYLFKKKKVLKIKEPHLLEIIHYLVSFFVRRNLTDIPPTRDLTRLFMKIIESIGKLMGEDVAKTIKDELSEVSSGDDIFRESLEGPVYSENTGVVRFILCAIEERMMNRENKVNLWEMDGKQYVWTIEHIFPQSEKIPKSWVDMIADGNKNKAKELQYEHVDRIGNLTISGYNSTLGNKSFEDKRDRRDSKGQFVGYKNGLYLNKGLSKHKRWTIDDIEKRTKRLVNETLDLFDFKETS